MGRPSLKNFLKRGAAGGSPHTHKRQKSSSAQPPTQPGAAQRRSTSQSLDDVPSASHELLVDSPLDALTDGSAYQKLVGLLSKGPGTSSKALRTRRNQEEGLSSEEDEEEGAAVGTDDIDDELEGSELGLPDMEEGEDGSDMEAAGEDNEAEAGADGSSEGEMGSTDSKDGTPQQNESSRNAAQQRPVRTHRRATGTAATAATGNHQAAVPKPSPSIQAGPDTWHAHMERQLTDSEIAALQGTQRVRWTDLDAPGFQGSVQGGTWQVCRLQPSAEATSLHRLSPGPAGAENGSAEQQGQGHNPLTVADSLDAYNVKERLLTRWREVAQEDLQQAQQDQETEEADDDATGTEDVDGDGSAPASKQKPGRSSSGPANGTTSRGKGDKGDAPDAQPGGDFVSPAQNAFLSALHSYADVTLPCRPYPTRLEDADPLMDAYLLHCLNHVAKAADKIKRNNDRLEQQQAKAREAAAAAAKAAAAAGKGRKRGGRAGSAEPEGVKEEAGAGAAPDPAPEEVTVEVPRDQGFTRPKVLILLPQRNLAFRLVLRLVRLAMRETRADSVQGKERFVEQFTDPEADAEREGAKRSNKPAEWNALLRSGNTDDHFRLGIKITRGAIKLFADLFQSDIIVASPLALATKLAEDAAKAAGNGDAGAKATAARAKNAKAAGSKGDGASDFLAGIEVLVIDRADMMTMQNWSHVEKVVEALNQLPREQHGTDIMRVREWALSGLARHYRQTVLLSSFLTPDMSALMCGPLAANHEGRVRVKPQPPGVLGMVVPQVQQVFERFHAATPVEAANARFEYFTRTVWPRLRDSAALGTAGGGLLLFVPTYFDFVRVRNFLRQEDNDVFMEISEYTPAQDVTSARARFFQRRVRVLLYTERAHFYFRHRIRGTRDLLFYAPPDHPHFYPELVNLLEDAGAGGAGKRGRGAKGNSVLAPGSEHGVVTVLYCKWDALALERIVGVQRARRMITAEAATFMFC